MIRANGIFMESVAGRTYWDAGTDGGTYVHNAAGRQSWDGRPRALVLRPGKPPLETFPQLKLTPKKYAVAGMIVPFELDADDARVARILWDEVPDLDDAVAARAEVFSDPDAAYARLAEAQQAFSGFALRPMGAVGEIVPGEPTGRVIACSPGEWRVELLLSVSVPGRPRFGVRWHGRLPRLKALPEWGEIPLQVGRGDKVDIPWERITGIIGVAKQRADEHGARLQALLDAPAAPAWTPGVPLAASAPDSATQLKQLADLHAAGALTDVELASERARVLGH
jgi:hypothetical protein